MTAWLPPVRLATTEDLTADGSGHPLTPATLDGKTVNASDTILVKDQTNPVQNGIWTAMSPAGTAMTRSVSTFDPESVVRVSEGDRNTHTQWALEAPVNAITVGTNALPWLRQDAKNYSFDTIAALKEFTAALMNATASLAGYYTPGDGAGGDFTFVGVPADGSATISAASAQSIPIASVVNADPQLGQATIKTVADAGLWGGGGTNVASVYLTGLTQGAVGTAGSIPLVGPFLVNVDSTTTFTLIGEHFAVVVGDGAAVKYVELITGAAHGVQPGARLALSGIVASGGALDLNRAWDGYPAGVINATHLSLPVLSSSGMYTPGPSTALVGDDALLVVATDSAGTIGGAWKRVLSTPLDPLWWGARVDDTTDDLPAYRAMHAAIPATGGKVALPDGITWLSDTWRISKPLQMSGIGGTGRSHAAFEVAPGRTAIRLDYSAVSEDGLDSSRHSVRFVDLKSRILVHETAHTSAFGNGIGNVFLAGATVRKGDCYIKADNVSPTRFYRTLNGGMWTVSVAEPAWSDMVADSVTDADGIVWVTEAFPTTRTNGATYAVGDRVYAQADNRFVYLCTAITTGIAGDVPPSQMVGGDQAPGVQIGSTVADGGVTWLVTVAAGMYVNSNLGTIEHVDAVGFTGAALHMQGGVGADARGGVNGTSVDNFRVRQIVVNFCGLGVHIAGGDANGWTVDGLFGLLLGVVQPQPNATGAGGHVLHDRSQGGGRVTDLYAQTSTGRAVVKNGIGNTTFVGCISELGVRDYFTNPQSLILGGSIVPTTDSDSVILLSQSIGQGIIEQDSHGPVTLRVYLTTQDGHSVLALYAPVNGDPGFYALKYGPPDGGGTNVAPGWWAMQHGNQAGGNAYLLSTAAAGLNPGPGWFGVQDGYLLGNPLLSQVFTGTVDMLTESRLREGARKIGDAFSIGTTRTTVVGDGFRGVPWTKLQVVRVNTVAVGIPATIVEPTANGEAPQAGLAVYKCTQAGKTGAIEPNWAVLAPNFGDHFIEAETTVEWTNVGTTPAMISTYGPGGGQAVINVAAANVTLTDAQASNEIIKFTGNGGASRNANFPAPLTDAGTYRRVIRNQSAGTIVVGNGVAGTVTIGAVPMGLTETTAQVGFDSGGAFRITADVST